MRLFVVACCLAAASALPAANNGKGKGRFGKLSEGKKKQMEESFSRTDVDKVAARLEAASKRAAAKANKAENKKRVDEAGKKVRIHERSPRLREGGETIEEVNDLEGLGDLFYGGDMILTPEQLDDVVPLDETRVKRAGAYKNSRYPNNTWIGGPVNWFFDPSLTHEHTKSIFQQAVDFWQSNTCIDFVQDATATNRIRVFQGVGCWSYVGKIGGQQDLSLGANCDYFGGGSHELAHALGFFHTQTRIDRDGFVVINMTNVAEDKQHNYVANTAASNFNYGKPYEYGSVMQYNKQAFATDLNFSAMIATNPLMQYTMGSDDVAFYDIDMMNEFYQCKGKCAAAPNAAQCTNGGFPHPRNCAQCICPEGFGGVDCNGGRPAGCGADAMATADWQTMSGVVGDNQTVIRDRHNKCHYRITAPAGKKVEVKLTGYYGVSCSGGCTYGGVEFKALADPAKQGYRFCCNQDVGQVIQSETNILPIILRNRYYRNTFAIQYRYV